MTSKTIPANGRLLKRNTLREECSRKVSACNPDAAAHDNCCNPRSVTNCKVSSIRPSSCASLLHDAKKSGTPGPAVEVLQGIPRIAPRPEESRTTTSRRGVGETEIKTHDAANTVTFRAQAQNISNLSSRAMTSGNALPKIRCWSARKIHVPCATEVHGKPQLADQAKHTSQQASALSSVRRHLSQCTIDANNLQPLTHTGWRAMTCRASAVPKTSNCFPTRGAAGGQLQGRRKIKNNSETAATVINSPNKANLDACRPASAKSVLSVHSLEICRPKPPASGVLRPGSRQRTKSLNSRVVSKSRETLVRSTHPPFPARLHASETQSNTNE